MQLQDFYHHRRVQNIQNDRRPRTTDDPEGGPEALHFQQTARRGEQLQLLPPFLDSPGGEQPQPLPAVETSEQIVAGEPLNLQIRTSPDG